MRRGLETPPEESMEKFTEADALTRQRTTLKKEIGLQFENPEFIENAKILNEATEERLKFRYVEMIRDMFSQTKALDEIHDTVGKNNLIFWGLAKKFPTTINFNATEYFEKKYGKEIGVLGTFSVASKEINLPDKKISIKDIWKCLLFHARLPEQISTLDHELTHYWYNEGRINSQNSEQNTITLKQAVIKNLINNSLFWETVRISGIIAKVIDEKITRQSITSLRFYNYLISEVIKNKPFFKSLLQSHLVGSREQDLANEVIATKAGDTAEGQTQTTIDLIEHLKTNYGFVGKGDLDKIIVVSQAVNRLRALGLADKEIAQAMARAAYDEKMTSFPSIDADISELAKEQGMDIYDVDYKVDLMRIENDVEQLKASKIAINYMNKFAEQQKSNPEKEGKLRGDAKDTPISGSA